MFYFIPDLKHFRNQQLLNNFKNITEVINPLPGTELGIPIAIFENIFTKLHYNFHPDIQYLFLIYSLIGYSTYGLDRYLDAIEYNDACIKPDISDSKVKLYNYIVNNESFIKITLILSYALLTNYFAQYSVTVLFLPFLILNTQYKAIKKNFSDIKSSLIGAMWVLSSVILPCVIYEHNYDILYDYQAYLPAFFALVSTSNLADIKDVEEDKINNINTIPVKFGTKSAYIFSAASLVLSSLIFFNHPNFEFNIENCAFQLTNIGGLYSIFKQNNDTLII